MRKIDEASDLVLELNVDNRERWRQELQDIELKRNDYLASCKVCKTRNNKVKGRWKDWQRGMNSSELPRKNRRPKWKTVANRSKLNGRSRHNWTWISEVCKRETEEEVVTNPNHMHECCSDSAMVEQFVTMGQRRSGSSFRLVEESSAKDVRYCISQRSFHPCMFTRRKATDDEG